MPQPPLADGNVSRADRVQITGGYAGILPAPASGISSRDRRASAAVVGRTWDIIPALPDGSISGSDRLQPLALYRGLANAGAISLINTRDKRASAMGFLQPWHFSPPLADANISGTDRQHSALSYRGIAAGTAATPVALSAGTVGIKTQSIVAVTVVGDAGGPGGDDTFVGLTGTWTPVLITPDKVATSNSKVALTGVALAARVIPVRSATTSESVQLAGNWTATNPNEGLTQVASSSESVELIGSWDASTHVPTVLEGGTSASAVELAGTFTATTTGVPTPCVVWTLHPSSGATEMTGKQFLDLLMFRMGKSNDAELRAAAALELVLAQQVLEGGPIKPWFLFTDHTCDAFRTMPGVERVLMPQGFLGLDEDMGAVLYWQNPMLAGPDVWQELDSERLRDMRREFLNSPAGPPRKYDFVSNFAYIRPFPDAIYNLRVFGAFVDALPGDNDLTNQWLIFAPDWLLAATGIQVAIKHVKDFELANEFRQDEQMARSRVQLEHQRRAHTGRLYSMGD